MKTYTNHYFKTIVNQQPDVKKVLEEYRKMLAGAVLGRGTMDNLFIYYFPFSKNFSIISM